MTNSDLGQLTINRTAPGPQRSALRPGRWVLAGAVLLALGFGGYRLMNPVARVSVVTVSRIYPSQTFTALNASGYVVAQRKAAVASKGTGRLIWLGVEEGSRVKEGQVIARLESDDLKAVTAQTRAALAAARANRETARAQRDAAAAARDNARAQQEAAGSGLEQAKAESDDATTALARERALFAGGMTAKVALDAAETRRRKGEAAYASAQHAREGARSAARAAEDSLAAAESAVVASGHAIAAAEAVLRGAEVNAGYTEIRAPFAGVVLTKNADIGDMVTPFGTAANSRAAVVTLADPTSLLVEADVSETSLPKVRVGQPCEVQLDSIPDTRFRAVVHMIVPTAERAKGTVLAKVRFAVLDPRILPEMSAKVAFLERPVASDELSSRVAVSPRALTTRGGNSTVFVVKSGLAAAIVVKAGAALGDLVEIDAGLAGGERAILDPPPKLHDGSKVTVTEE